MISHNSICDWYEVSLEIPYLGDTAKCLSVNILYRPFRYLLLKALVLSCLANIVKLAYYVNNNQ